MVRKYLPHYYDLLNDKDAAYYVLCRDFIIEWPNNTSIKNLWEIHNNYSAKFRKIVKKRHPIPYKAGFFLVDDLIIDKSRMKKSLLDLKIEIANQMIKNCDFCENKCYINRKDGEIGKCGITDKMLVSDAYIHMGEEEPFIPSGTIFFAGCTFNCVFCQNWDISTYGKALSQHDSLNYPSDMGGKIFSDRNFARLVDKTVDNGAININYVGGDPTPNIHVIISSLKYQTRNICQIWNSNLYNTISSLQLLIDIIDLWLPDFKYGNNECAMKYSGVINYWDILTRNLKFIHNWGSRDICIRHLIMPNHYECCTMPILKWIAKELPGIVVHIMGQYHPDHKVNSNSYPEINRYIYGEEIANAFNLADNLGIEYKLVSK